MPSRPTHTPAEHRFRRGTSVLQDVVNQCVLGVRGLPCESCREDDLKTSRMIPTPGSLTQYGLLSYSAYQFQPLIVSSSGPLPSSAIPCMDLSIYRSMVTIRASLSGTFLQTLPDLVTPLKGDSLSPRSCPPTRSAPSERFGY